MGSGRPGGGPRNLKATGAGESYRGREPTDQGVADAARRAAEAAEPKDDIRGSAAYKKDMVRVFVQRGLRAAIKQAQEVRA